MHNDFVDANLFLAEIAIKEKEDVSIFFQKLPEVRDACVSESKSNS